MSGGLEIRLTKIKIRVDRDAATAEARADSVRRVANWVRKAQNQAIIDCPVDTGLLRSHHRIQIKEMVTKVKGRVYNDTKYAAAVHDGSRAHIIRGRRQRKPTKKRPGRGVKMLRFKINGQVIFRRSVYHPGSKGRPWLLEAGKKVSASEGFTWRETSSGGDEA
jgi:hypothetical protein